MATRKTKSGKSKAWVVGKGHEGLEEHLSPGAKRIVSASEKGAATGKLGSVTAAATAGSDHAERLTDTIVAQVASGVTEVNIVAVADSAGISASFARFWLRSKAKDVLSDKGIDIAIKGDSFTATVQEGATLRTKAAAKAKSVKAAETKPAKPPKRDKDYFVFDKTLVAKIKVAVANTMNIWLAGPTGCGKTEYLTRVLEALKVGSIKASFHGEASADDLLGHYTLRDGETVWVEGALVRAMKEGVPLICEEIDAAPAEANLAMQRALETRHGHARSFHNARNGEEVVAEKGFCILATANSTGGGDHTGLYTGLQVQNAAFRNRFVFEKVDYLDDETEVRVLVTRTGIPEHIARKAREFAEAARNAVTNGELFTPISTRSLLAFGDMLSAFVEVMEEQEAVREALLSSCIYPAANPSDEEALRGLMQRVFGIR